MASSLTAASASASGVSKASANLRRLNNNHPLSKLSFRLSPKPNFLFLTEGLRHSQNCSTVVKAQLNEVRFFQWFSLEDLFSNIHSFLDTLLASSFSFKVGVDGSSNAAATHPPTKSEVVAPEAKDANPSNDPSGALATEESISEFIAQVSSLVKLVDSRDIVELQLKQLDCEVLIRKKEALPQPPPLAPVTFTHSHAPLVAPSAQPVPAPAPVPSPAAAVSGTSTSSAVKSAKSSLPPLKCPMAGTFYRSPGPGEPAFVKVGDKVQKGQVLCIIEAMKLMNEIEADQSGTIVEILAEDGKPVSVDMPLFIIEP
ncbi:biotin carboxyl carrier protein of acetyl-CoA carboxylase, chloroplastic-like isoform X1 [Carya illinoinensis]|uniref:biotin carboxyl carrier protein of acetyl-CoA carboxylase, chloroplastic-like isoform X1 n=1 Tax=Carya illinoinensis TaxID=32201 RepID=UPI001C7181FB|nr:biotin carboxyl carrier protein of acetyl-CoA carboxylase, chloroplastic-like isoform X1 [Carya illinoinensis]